MISQHRDAVRPVRADTSGVDEDQIGQILVVDPLDLLLDGGDAERPDAGQQGDP